MESAPLTPVPRIIHHAALEECQICFEEAHDFIVLHPGVRHQVCNTCWTTLQGTNVHCPFCRRDFRTNVAILPSPRTIQNHPDHIHHVPQSPTPHFNNHWPVLAPQPLQPTMLFNEPAEEFNDDYEMDHDPYYAHFEPFDNSEDENGNDEHVVPNLL